MTARRPCPAAPGPLEDFAVHFDALFHSLAQRHGFRTYLAGLLAPRDRRPSQRWPALNRCTRRRQLRSSNSNSSCPNPIGMPMAFQALQEYPDRLRGVAVPSVSVSEAELDQWAEAGVCGVRFNLYKLEGHAVYRNGVGLDVLEALAPRIAARGWHAQIWVHAPDLVELAPRLRKLGLPLVIDHMGRMSTARGADDPGFRLLCNMLADGVAWTKISGADRNTVAGAPYADVDPMAHAILKANIERVVWGTDWPHINYFEQQKVPDDGELLNLLARWMPDEKRRYQVLVANPAKLYGFPTPERTNLAKN